RGDDDREVAPDRAQKKARLPAWFGARASRRAGATSGDVRLGPQASDRARKLLTGHLPAATPPSRAVDEWNAAGWPQAFCQELAIQALPFGTNNVCPNRSHWS